MGVRPRGRNLYLALPGVKIEETMKIGTIFGKIGPAIAELGASKLVVLLENRTILPDLHPTPLLGTVASDSGKL